MDTKNIFKKAAPAVLGLSVLLLTASSFVPAVASANNGLHLGLGLGHKMDKESRQISADVRAFASNDSFKTAQQTYKTSVKQANTTYQAAVKAAKDKFSAAMQASTDFSTKLAAWKVYMTEKLAAFKAKNTAIEAAFQAFINANFTAGNQAPVANSLNISVNKNTATPITLTGSDPENSALTFMVVSNPAHGTLSGTAPNLTYTPAANFSGSDSFTFKVNDGSLNSTVKTISITVNP
ncbi:cadherin-like domain-containing protein [Candidatus Parcubacteria bacterium]|nr:cadherin-like domain-containing protein [Candidatus Parcubacteria bacterium]